MATNNMHNLTTLIKRLEAATSRIEDIASSINTIETAPTTNGAPIPSASAHSTSAAAAAVTPPNPSTSSVNVAPAALPEEIPTPVEAYDKLIDGELADFVKLSSDLDPLLAQQSKELKAAFDAQREFLYITTMAKNPGGMSEEFMTLAKDTEKKMTAVDDMRQQNRASSFMDHLSLVAEGSATLGWIGVSSKPADTIAEVFGGAQMFGNRILRKYKDNAEQQQHVEWVKAFYALQRALIAYIKEHYARGLQWNPQGTTIPEALKARKQKSSAATPAPPAPSAGGPPPPPPPPPPGSLGGPGGLPPPPPPKSSAPAPDMGAVFQQLNQGEAITSGLKKVDPSQMTHKNPSLRATAPVPERSNSTGSTKSIPPHTKPKPESMRTKKPPRKELDSNKWIIENFENTQAPVEIQAERNHSILITKCKNAIIRVVGKANAISIDSSVKTSIIVDSLVSSVDVIKCPSFALQVLETLPTILLDQVDGATIYLGKDSLNTEVFTSKCSNVNVYLPGATEEDDSRECNIPEQFRSFVKDGKLVTEIVEHMG